jgi:hypothetical protein
MRRLIEVLGTIALCVASAHAASGQSSDTSSTRARPTPPANLPSVKPATPPACCTVVRIDTTRAVVTARETATGFTFRFEVKNRRLLSGINVGQHVWADFTKKTVRLNAASAAPCCAILTQETP